MSWYSYRAAGGPVGVELPPGPENAVDHPTGPQREDRVAIPLIAHLIWPDREEWRAVTARNWTADRVLVTWPPTATERGGACWLRAADVTRVVLAPLGGTSGRDADDRRGKSGGDTQRGT